MNIAEMERKLQEDGMLKAHVSGVIKNYSVAEELSINGEFNNCINAYGIYKSKTGRFCFVVTESERGGIVEYSSVCDTEEEACEELIDFMYTEERIYQKKHN